MNIFSILILSALIIDFTLGLTANLLNLKVLKLELPYELETIYKPEDYRKSQKYSRVTTRFGIISSTFNLVLLLTFWFLGGFNYLDQVIRSWQLILIINGLLYIGIMFLGYYLITLPFDIYATFVIEKNFQFNRTTKQTFFSDQLKELGLIIVLGGLLLAAILTLFEYAGTYAWLYCWGAVTIFSLGIQYIYPIWIMPLFNRFKPMETGELKDAIIEYTSSVDFPVKNISVMDGSRRSNKANAFFTGFGKNKRIALFDTLIEQHSVPELVAILAHEIGHYKKKHIIQGTIISILHVGVLFFLLSLFLGSNGLYQAFYIKESSIYAGLLFFGLLYTPIELVLSIAMQMVSRRNEYSADRFAATTIKDQDNIVTALKKLHANNLSNLTPHPFFVFLNYSHPPLLQRIRAIQNIRRNE
jgi:STE24 endopeptidase